MTGSAHTVLAPFWSSRLRKNLLRARQCSARGGELGLLLWCPGTRQVCRYASCELCLAFRARGQGRGEDHSGPGLGHHCSRRNDRSLKWTWTINNTLKRNALVLHHSFCVVATCEEFPSSTMWILLTKLTKTLLRSPLYEYIGLIPSQSAQNHKVSPLTYRHQL